MSSTTASLCSFCTIALNPIYESRNAGAFDTGYVRHHLTMHSLYSSAKDKCYICSISWENAALSQPAYFGHVEPTSLGLDISCRLHRDIMGDGSSIVKFETFLNHVEFTCESRFRLIPSTGMCAPMSVQDVNIDSLGCRWTWILRLACMTDKMYQYMFPEPRLDPSTSSLPSLQSAYDWYSLCRSNHHQCAVPSRMSPGWLPTRLIDIGQDGQATTWRLVLTKDADFTSPPPYLSLSYRWGTEPQKLLLLSSTKADFLEGGLMEDLPATFRDLAALAHRLSIRYVWIDALCIIQNSKSDWEREAPTMRYVYANAACSISATASEDPNGGLFRNRDGTESPVGILRAPSSAPHQHDHYVLDKSYWDRRLLTGPLHRRGWVFQERHLAPRVLHFAQDQIMWECLEGVRCEGFPHGLPYHRSAKDLAYLWQIMDELHQQELKDDDVNGTSLDAPDSWSITDSEAADLVAAEDIQLSSIWDMVVATYTQCALTKASDKLPALSGIAMLFHQATHDRYVAGLWMSHILRQLDWRVYKPVMRLSEGYRAPTWSWACLDGPVRPHGHSTGMEFLVSVQDFAVECASADDFGPVSSASISLRGSVVSASVHSYNRETNYCVLRAENCHIEGLFLRDCLQVELAKCDVIHCLLFKSYPELKEQTSCSTLACLVLEPVLCSVSENYRRIGMFVVDSARHVCREQPCIRLDEEKKSSSADNHEKQGEVHII